MSNGTPKSLIIIGSDGLIATALLKIDELYDHYEVVYGISKRSVSSSNHRNYSHIQGDGGDESLLRQIVTSVPDPMNFEILNLAIDKSSFHAMIGSLRRITKAVISIVKEYPNVSATVMSSSAVLAPSYLRTTYARVKLQELKQFQDVREKTKIIICPQVIESSSQHTTESTCAKLFIDLPHVAHLILHVLTDTSAQTMCVPAKNDLGSIDASGTQLGMVGFIKTLYQLFQDPRRRHYAERQLTYGLISLMPRSVRRKVDHHQLPDKSIDKLAYRIGLFPTTISLPNNGMSYE